MKYTLWFPVHIEGRGHYATYLKDVETASTLLPGIEIKDDAWDDPVKIDDVTFIVAEDVFNVKLAPAKVQDERAAREREDIFFNAGWLRGSL